MPDKIQKEHILKAEETTKELKEQLNKALLFLEQKEYAKLHKCASLIERLSYRLYMMSDARTEE